MQKAFVKIVKFNVWYISGNLLNKISNYFLLYNYFFLSANVVNTLLRQLEGLRQGQYLTGRVKQLVFNYLTEVLVSSNKSITTENVTVSYQNMCPAFYFYT